MRRVGRGESVTRTLPGAAAVYQREADEARADPSLLPAFKALRLNQGTADHEIAVLVTAEQWAAG